MHRGFFEHIFHTLPIVQDTHRRLGHILRP